MTLKPYLDCHKTDNEWVPSLPAHWKSTQLRHVARIYAGGTPDRSNVEFWRNGTVPWLNSGSVNDWIVTSPSEWITEEAASGGRTRWVPSKSVLIALAGQGKTKGLAARLEINSTCNQSMAAVVPTKYLDYRFAQFWISANYQNVRNLAGGDLRDGLNLQHIGGIHVPIPPKEEQVSIANFLDQETAEIDAFVADQEELIELLSERRSATITRAVTKGLDPNAPIMSSSLTDVDSVPEHWKKSRLKWGISKIESGVSVNAQDAPVQRTDEIGVLKTSCVYSGEFDPTKNKIVNPEDLNRVACPVRAGTLIVSRMNTPQLVASAGYVTRNEPRIYLPDRLWQVHFSDSWNAQFVHYWTQTKLYRTQVEAVCIGTSSSMQNIGQNDFRDFTLYLPPKDEQLAIVNQLHATTAEVDAAIADAREAIALSKERRAAVISAAVTGKIDVRGLVDPETSGVEGASVGAA